MSTRSTIALEYPGGKVGQVYCHWDGYLDHNGRLLLAHWSDPAKLAKLIALGSVSVLRPEIGPKHPFDNPHEYRTERWEAWEAKHAAMCRFYGRDRGETKGIQPSWFPDFETFATRHFPQQFNYVLRADGTWFVSVGDKRSFVLLTEAMATVKP